MGLVRQCEGMSSHLPEPVSSSLHTLVVWPMGIIVMSRRLIGSDYMRI
jgi:hypothetical protein